jgi:endonuclease YncB( thermonuclease family)
MARLLFCLLMLLGATAQASEYTAKVIAVLDGDTLLVMRSGKPIKLRLVGIDAPEKAQPHGIAAQQSLAEMTMGRMVKVITRARDDYGRTVAEVFTDDLNVNHEQVRRGMAWEYSRFHNNHELSAMQNEAQQQKLGLWSGADVVEPSQWRKQHPRVQPTPAQSSVPSATTCVGKHSCAQMNSCEEARQALARCGPESLDGDRDGVPCEKLCLKK